MRKKKVGKDSNPEWVFNNLTHFGSLLTQKCDCFASFNTVFLFVEL